MEKYTQLTAQGVEIYLNTLSEINWFNIQENDRDTIYSRLLNLKQEDFFSSLYNLWFDTEGFSDDRDYGFLLDEILNIIKIKVLDKEVVYDKDNNSVTVKILTERDTYSYKINLNKSGGWIDMDFIDIFINKKLLAGENIKNKFFALPIFDQSIQFVFVPEETYNAAIEIGIIPRINSNFK